MSTPKTKKAPPPPAGELESARAGLVKAESRRKTTKEQARAAKRRSQEAKLAARRAKKQAKAAKEELAAAKKALAKLEAKLRKSAAGKPAEKPVPAETKPVAKAFVAVKRKPPTRSRPPRRKSARSATPPGKEVSGSFSQGDTADDAASDVN